MKKGSKKINKNDLSLGDLATQIQQGFTEVGKKLDLSDKRHYELEDLIDNLAVMTAKGFEDVNGRLLLVKEELIRKINGSNARIDDLALNRVKYEAFEELSKKVKLLEHKHLSAKK